jgi:hypothetical protein
MRAIAAVVNGDGGSLTRERAHHSAAYAARAPRDQHALAL